MPELPEVETVCEGLRRSILGKTIHNVRITRKDIRDPLPPHLAEALTGRRVMSIKRRAKYICMHMDDANVLLVHLGMSGRVTVHYPARSQAARHDHVMLYFAEGEEWVFHDPRRFGRITLVQESDLASHPWLASLGVEPLEDSCDAAFLMQQCEGKKQPIKTALMDQQIVVGVGNIYASESLFQAGVHPMRPAGEVSYTEWENIVRAVKAVLKAAIASGGSTLRDYVRSTGDMGYFQHQFQVYGREGKPCTRCQAPIVRWVLSGRSTYGCPKCQK